MAGVEKERLQRRGSAGIMARAWCRCRYLEQSGCASVCVNSCKVPTQEFFEKDMGMSVSMEPNYDDFSCQFVFGKKPLPQSEDEVFTTPCFEMCPSKRHERQQPQCDTVVPAAE